MIKLNFNTYLSFDPSPNMDMILAGWSYKQYWLFIIYKK